MPMRDKQYDCQGDPVLSAEDLDFVLAASRWFALAAIALVVALFMVPVIATQVMP